MGFEHIISRLKKASILVSVIFLSLSLLISTDIKAEEGKTVRVGWYESPFNITDQYGRKSGYAYEYQRKIAAYTGWEYEYVERESWSELLEMLKRGEIDLLSDVSYTEERTKDLLYASLPMGTEAYYLLINSANKEIQANDYTSLNGKTIGITTNSIQRGLLLDWLKKHNVDAELLELSCSEDEAIRRMKEKEMDAFVTMDFYADPIMAVPIYKIGSSDFYFALNKNRTDLLSELDAAMNKIQDENRYYNQQLYEQYLSNIQTQKYLSEAESKWLADHGVIRVAYQNNYLAFCASDENTGELTGALKDYLDYAATCLDDVEITFEAKAYPTAAAAMEALANNEADCMFPANLTDYDGETIGVVMSPPLMRTEMDAVVRINDQKSFIRKDDITVAVNEGNPNYDLFLMDNYPEWQTVHFKDTPTCLEEVAKGNADCIIISNYRFSNISKQCEKLHLSTVYTGVDMDYCFALREGDTELYSIIARIAGIVPDSTINAALTYYSTEDVKITFADLIRDNLFIVMSIIAVILFIILILLLRSIRAEKKASEEEHLLNDLNRKIFVDALTSVRNKGAFSEYMEKLQERIDKGEDLHFAVGVFDCNNLKKINDRNGHDKGDIYLKTASRLICNVFTHSPVFRIGGDEFAVVLLNDDYENREELIKEFYQECEKISVGAANEWEEAHVAVGVAVYDKEVDEAVDDTMHRADKIMYENKRIQKAE